MTEGSPDLETICAILGDSRRRCALAVLGNRGRTSLSELAVEIASHERETESSEVPPPTVDEISLSLYHVHVPTLVDANVVEYDRDRNRLEATGLEDLEPFLSMALEADPRALPTPSHR